MTCCFLKKGKRRNDTTQRSLQHYREHGVKDSERKIPILTTLIPVTYLGLRYDGTGLHPTGNNLDDINQAPSPRRVSELRAFLGMRTLYSRFLLSMSSLPASLYLFLQQGCHWRCGQEQEEAFRKARAALTEASVLTHLDPEKELLLECDGSPHGVNAVYCFIGLDANVDQSGFDHRRWLPLRRTTPS